MLLLSGQAELFSGSVNCRRIKQLFLSSSSWLSSYVVQPSVDLFFWHPRQRLVLSHGKDMSDLSIHMPGGGCPDANALVVWALCNEAEDVSSTHGLATAAFGSGDHKAEDRLQVGIVLQKWASSVHVKGGRGRMQDFHAVHGASMGRKSHLEWDAFHSSSLLAQFPQHHLYWVMLSVTQFHSTSHHTGKEILLLWFYVKKLFGFSSCRWWTSKSGTIHSEYCLSSPCSSAHACKSLFTEMLTVTWFCN